MRTRICSSANKLDLQFLHYERGGRKIKFKQMLLGNSLERNLNEEYCYQDSWLRLKNNY